MLNKLQNLLRSQNWVRGEGVLRWLPLCLAAACIVIPVTLLGLQGEEEVRRIAEKMLGSKIPGADLMLYLSQILFVSNLTALGTGIGTGNLITLEAANRPFTIQQAIGSSKRRKFFQIFNQTTLVLTVIFIIGTFLLSYSNAGILIWTIYSIPSKGNILVYSLLTVVICIGLSITAIQQWQSLVHATTIRIRALDTVFTKAGISVKYRVKRAFEFQVFYFAHVYTVGATFLFSSLPDICNFLPLGFSIQLVLLLLLAATSQLKLIDRYLSIVDRFVERSSTHDFGILVTNLNISTARSARKSLRVINALLNFGYSTYNFLNYRAHYRYAQNYKATLYQKLPSELQYLLDVVCGTDLKKKFIKSEVYRQYNSRNIKKFTLEKNWKGSFVKIPFSLESVYSLFWVYGIANIYTHPSILLILHKYTITNFLWVYVYAKGSIAQNNFSAGVGDLVAFLIPGFFFAFFLGILLSTLYFGNLLNDKKTLLVNVGKGPLIFLGQDGCPEKEKLNLSDYFYIINYITFLYMSTLEFSVKMPGGVYRNNDGVDEFCVIIDAISKGFNNFSADTSKKTDESKPLTLEYTHAECPNVPGYLPIHNPEETNKIDLVLTYPHTPGASINVFNNILSSVKDILTSSEYAVNFFLLVIFFHYSLVGWYEVGRLHTLFWSSRVNNKEEFIQELYEIEPGVLDTTLDMQRNFITGLMVLIYFFFIMFPTFFLFFEIILSNTSTYLTPVLTGAWKFSGSVDSGWVDFNKQLENSLPQEVSFRISDSGLIFLPSNDFLHLLLDLESFSLAKHGDFLTLQSQNLNNPILSSFFMDGLSLFLIWLTGVVCFTAQIFLLEDSIEDFSQQTFQLFLVAVLAAFCFHTADLLLFFVSFETILLPLFFMIGTFGSRPEKVNGAFFLLVYTLVGSLFLWPALLYFIVVLKTTNFFEIAQALSTSSADLRGMLWCCLFIGFAFKVPIVPVHLWLTVAHVEAPTVGSMLLAGLILKLGGYGILRFVCALFTVESLLFSHLVIGFCCLGYTWATIMATRQADIKRFVAYTSISHMNFALAVLFTLKDIGFGAFCHTMISHGLIATGLFGLVGFIYKQTASRDIVHLTGLANNLPFFAVYWFIFSMANVGLPFFSGFPGEFFGLTALLSESRAAVLCFFIGFYLSAVYAFVVVSRLLYGTSGNKVQHLSDLTTRVQQSVGLLGVLSLLLGLAPGAIFNLTPLSIGEGILKSQHVPTHNNPSVIISKCIPIPEKFTHT